MELINKIFESPIAPKSNDCLWIDNSTTPASIKANINGVWAVIGLEARSLYNSLGAYEFVTDKQYYAGDFVFYDGKLYQFITATKGKWDETAVVETNLETIIRNAAHPAGIAYTDIEALVEALNTADVDDFPIGFDLYVSDTAVPDYWIARISDTSVEYTYTDDNTFIADVRSAISTGVGLLVGYFFIGEREQDTTQSLQLKFTDEEETERMWAFKVTPIAPNTNA